jgi:hypothetical protein
MGALLDGLSRSRIDYVRYGYHVRVCEILCDIILRIMCEIMRATPLRL